MKVYHIPDNLPNAETLIYSGPLTGNIGPGNDSAAPAGRNFRGLSCSPGGRRSRALVGCNGPPILSLNPCAYQEMAE